VSGCKKSATVRGSKKSAPVRGARKRQSPELLRTELLRAAALAFIVFTAAPASAQVKTGSAGIDDIFDNPEDVELGPEADAAAGKGGKLRKNPINAFIESFFSEAGFAVSADYDVRLFYFPGWNKSPWEEGFDSRESLDYKNFAVNMNAVFGLDLRVSSALRFWQSLKFSLFENSGIYVNEFYCDYNLMNFTFFKLGKYNYKWGSSPNFPYTDLLSRLPLEGKDSPEDAGNSYFLQVNIPAGVGSVQIISFTRDGFVDNWDAVELGSFAFGGKLNLALTFIDIDAGTLYFSGMPWRSFVSLKKTLFKSTEVYAEGLVSVPAGSDKESGETNDAATGSFSFGFYQDFFRGKLKINAEAFFNYEFSELTFYYREDPFKKDEDVSFPFVPGINTALNVSFKPGALAGLNIALKFVYSFRENSGEIIPGLMVSPAQNLQLYFGLPLVLGGSDGVYYNHNLLNPRLDKHPLGLVFLISLNGSYKFSHY